MDNHSKGVEFDTFKSFQTDTPKQNVFLNLFQNLPSDQHDIEYELKFCISLKTADGVFCVAFVFHRPGDAETSSARQLIFRSSAVRNDGCF